MQKHKEPTLSLSPHDDKGFTYFELIVVIAFIGAVMFTILNGSNRQQELPEARDVTRRDDVAELFSALSNIRETNINLYRSMIDANMNPNQNYMIGSCNDKTDPQCDAKPCSVFIYPQNGLALAVLLKEGNLTSLPISPSVERNWNDIVTGYYIHKSKAGALTVGACESENIAVPITQGDVPQDRIPPARTLVGPTGSLPNNTNETSVGWTTDEVATCRYAERPNRKLEKMEYTVETPDGFLHAFFVSKLKRDSPYTYYIKCQDTAGNINPDDFVISFSVQ